MKKLFNSLRTNSSSQFRRSSSLLGAHYITMAKNFSRHSIFNECISFAAVTITVPSMRKALPVSENTCYFAF